MNHLFTLWHRDSARRVHYLTWHFRFDVPTQMNWYFTQGMN